MTEEIDNLLDSLRKNIEVAKRKMALSDEELESEMIKEIRENFQSKEKIAIIRLTFNTMIENYEKSMSSAEEILKLIDALQGFLSANPDLNLQLLVPKPSTEEPDEKP